MIDKLDASGMPGFNEFMEVLTSTEGGGMRGVMVPHKLSESPAISNVKVMWNKENPQLVFAPLCSHRSTGYWVVAVFHAVDTEEDGSDSANLRASLAVSLVAGEPVVIHGDCTLICTEGWGNDPEHPAFTPPMNMPSDIADEIRQQFDRPSNFTSGLFVKAAQEHGHPVTQIVTGVIEGHQWDGLDDDNERRTGSRDKDGDE